MLLFIRCCFLVFSLKSSISKHLMLLFIINITFWCICISYISKHLMLLFIGTWETGQDVQRSISKHLMLLFIMYRRPFPATAVCISKHLMLLFIYLAISGIVEFLKFQNILCYCLSISTAECRTNRIISKHLMLLFIVMQHRKRDQQEDFKTSYVIVYRSRTSWRLSCV